MATKKVTKKSNVKVAPKKPGVKKSSAKAPAQMRSFRVAKDPVPFLNFKITLQTIYWTILVLFIIVVQLWIIKTQLDIVTLTETSRIETEMFNY